MMETHFDIRGLLEQLGYTEIREFPTEFRALPIYRESRNKTALAIKKDTGQWIDFVLGIKGSFPELVKLSLNLTTVDEAQQWLRGKDVNISVVHRPKEPKIKNPKVYDSELLLKLLPDYSYWVNRNIRQEVVERFKGGLVNVGKMAGRFVFPIFNNKAQIVGFTGRDVYNNNRERPKWKHISSTSEWVYPAFLNYQKIRASKMVILVESIGDCLALFNAGIEHVIVTFGLNLSSAVINFLIRMDVTCIIIALNNDGSLTGAGNQAAQKMQSKLCHFFDEHQVEIALPDKKDFGEMNVEEILAWQKKRHCQPQA